MDVDSLTDAAMKFAALIYDSKSGLGSPSGAESPSPEGNPGGATVCGGILVKHLKVFFVVMSEGRLREKMLYLFRQFAESSNNNCMTRWVEVMVLARANNQLHSLVGHRSH